MTWVFIWPKTCVKQLLNLMRNWAESLNWEFFDMYSIQLSNFANKAKNCSFAGWIIFNESKSMSMNIQLHTECSFRYFLHILMRWFSKPGLNWLLDSDFWVLIWLSPTLENKIIFHESPLHCPSVLSVHVAGFHKHYEVHTFFDAPRRILYWAQYSHKSFYSILWFQGFL